MLGRLKIIFVFYKKFYLRGFMVSPVPTNTINSLPNFSPQQSDATSEMNRAPKPASSQQPESPKEATEAKTTEVADAVLTEQASEKPPASYFDQAKEILSEIEQEFKLFNRPIIAVKQPFWFVKALTNAYQTYMGTAPADPFLDKRKILQEAIEKAHTTEDLGAALEKVELVKLLKEPLPNGHLPLNYTIFKGNMTAMKILLRYCSPEQRDFQSQTALDVAHVTGNEEVQKTLKAFLVEQEQMQLIQSLKGKKPEEINQAKVVQVLQDMEKNVDKALAERTIVDPLALSMNDKIACVAAILWLAGQTFSDSSLLTNHYSATYLLPALATMSQISEMRHVWENAGHLPTLVSSAATICAMVPSLQFIYKPFKVGMMSLSMLNTLKATADNYRLRGWDSVTKLAVSSMNFYHFWNHTAPVEKKEWTKIEDLSDQDRKTINAAIKKALIPLHPDQLKGSVKINEVADILTKALNGARENYGSA